MSKKDRQYIPLKKKEEERFIKMLSSMVEEERTVAMKRLCYGMTDRDFLSQVLRSISENDDSEYVRSEANGLLGLANLPKGDPMTCRYLAAVVGNTDAGDLERKMAYFSLLRICEEPVYLDQTLESLLANARLKVRKLQEFSNFKLATDIDWNFVRQFCEEND